MDVLLSPTDRASVRYLLAAEPVQGSPLPGQDVLEHLVRLVPCDAIGLALLDLDGSVLDGIVLPRQRGGALPGPACPWPRERGIQQWPLVPTAAEQRRALDLADSVGAGFRTAPDRMVLLWLDRQAREFTARDVALLAMVVPAVERLVRDAASACPYPTAGLTVRERQTLSLVADGLSNGEVAERMGIETCTVRKHLEHAYRKLGVANRVAAATTLGRAPAPEDSRNGELWGPRMAR